MTNRILVFSIATNGYQWLYEKNLHSHEMYAKRMGYSYVCIKKPGICTLGIECAWLKILLMQQALKSGYDWVLFVDADAEIKSDTPRIESIEEDGKDLYFCLGYSKRINSGVMIVRNTFDSFRFFETVLRNMDMVLPTEDQVGWGENGHIIYFAKQFNNVSIIDYRWNNNWDKRLKDFIRHYSAGPLRREFKPNTSSKLLYVIGHCITAIARRFSYSTQRPDHSTFKAQLYKTHQRVLRHYPEFAC